MEYSEKNIHSFKIYVNTSPDSGSTQGYGFVHEGALRTLQSFPQNDFYIPVFLTRTAKQLEYVDISYDNSTFIIERQEVNPWFIEFSFFDTIIRNKTNEGANLTTGIGLSAMTNYIRFIRPDLSGLSDNDLKLWFDMTGKYQLPWNKGLINETDLDTLDKLTLLNQNIISKANVYKIDINK